MLAFSVVQVVLSQFPGLEHITWLSVVAAAMSFAYSFAGLGLSVGHWVSRGGGGLGGRVAGAAAASSTRKLWNVLLALGNIAFAYTFAEVLIEIQVSTYIARACNQPLLFGQLVTTFFVSNDLTCSGSRIHSSHHHRRTGR
jgi:hypothetical protein